MKKRKAGDKVNLSDITELKRGSFWLRCPDTTRQWENVEDLPWVAFSVHSAETHRDGAKPPAYAPPTKATQVAEVEQQRVHPPPRHRSATFLLEGMT